MRAFVLSGGGNYGPLQVGALQVLLEHGIWPEILVGTSVGALNASWLASVPTLAGLQNLARIWVEGAPRLYSSINPLVIPLRLARSDGLLSNEPLLRIIQRWAPPEKTFGELAGPRLFMVATCLRDGSMRVFGDRSEDRPLDGLMSSTALPLIFPPWIVDGEAYIDGGTSCNLPLRVAAERGADEIIALQICTSSSQTKEEHLHGTLAISMQAIFLLLGRLANQEIENMKNEGSTRLHLIQLHPDQDPGFWNFNSAVDMILAGRRITEQYLHSPEAESLLVTARP